MKKLLLILTIGAFTLSCGGGEDDKKDDKKDICACLEEAAKTKDEEAAQKCVGKNVDITKEAKKCFEARLKKENKNATKSVKVADLKDPCDCAEAYLQVMEALVPHSGEMKNMKSEEEALSYMKKHNLLDLQKKMEELENKCRDFGEPGDDCAAAKKLEELMKQMM